MSELSILDPFNPNCVADNDRLPRHPLPNVPNFLCKWKERPQIMHDLS